MTLADFTEDAGSDDAGPEDTVKHELTEWLRGHGAVEVFWEKANPWQHPTFRTDGTDRPDLLVETESGTTAAVETKHDNSGMYRAPVQLQRYWEAYIDGEVQYRADGERVGPDLFVLATGGSPDGHLFETEYDSDCLQTWDAWGDSRYPRSQGWLPQVEYNATKSAVRIMWQYAAAFLDARNDEPGVGIGALLSTKLDGEDDGRPRLLYYLDREQYWEGLR
jgi:hypothetical protein